MFFEYLDKVFVAVIWDEFFFASVQVIVVIMNEADSATVVDAGIASVELECSRPTSAPDLVSFHVVEVNVRVKFVDFRDRSDDFTIMCQACEFCLKRLDGKIHGLCDDFDFVHTLTSSLCL